MKKYLLVITAFIVSIGINSYSKDPSPEITAKTQEIIKAIEKKDVASLKELVKDRDAINVVQTGSYDSSTPLITAVSFYDKDKDEKTRLDMINLLLEAGAKVDLANNQNETPLIKAAGRGNVNVVNLLIKSGANVNASDKIGITALMRAVEVMDSDIVEALIKNKADIKKRDNICDKNVKGKGDSAVFFCINANSNSRNKLNTACFDLLLANGADPAADTGGQNKSFIEMLFVGMYSNLTNRYTGVDDEKTKYLEDVLLKSSSYILKNKPNYLIDKTSKKTMLMILAEYTPYVSSETLETILNEAAQSKADFSIKSSARKTAFDYLPAIYTGKTVEGAVDNLKLVRAYELFKKYNAMSGRPYKDAEKVLEAKTKH